MEKRLPKGWRFRLTFGNVEWCAQHIRGQVIYNDGWLVSDFWTHALAVHPDELEMVTRCVKERNGFS